jgi:centriolar protein POC1
MHCEIINHERIDAHKAPIYAMHRNENGIYTGGADRQLIFQDAQERGICHVLATFSESIFSICTAQNEIWVGGFQGHCYRISPHDQRVSKFEAHQGPVYAMALINEEWLATAGADGKIHIWDLHQASIIRSVWLGDEKIRSLRFDSINQQLWVGSADGSLTLLDIPWFNTLEKWIDPGNPCYDLGWLPQKEVFVTAHKNGRLHFWKKGTTSPLLSIPAHMGAIYTLYHEAERNLLFTGSVDKCLKCWDLNSMELLWKRDHYENLPFRSINKIDFWNNEIIICGDQSKIDFIKICFFE